METVQKERIFHGNNISIVKQDKECTIYQLKDATGEGFMTCYKVFDGIELIYNDFHIQSCFSEFKTQVEMIGIDHCREGRIEWEFQDGSYMYLQEGDLQIDTRGNHTKRFGLPLGHYHGITIAIYIEEAKKEVDEIFEGYPVDLYALKEKFCSGKRIFIIRAEEAILHIFAELYSVPEKIRTHYFKIKVLELLLFLSVLDVSENDEERAYFPKKQVEIVKRVMDYMRQHLDRHFTLEQLAEQFDIPLTSMKTCFKGVYGMSIYAYMRTYRMQAAAAMLRESKENITIIAGKVGYDNASKFAAAFKEVMNFTPSEYRKNYA